MTNQSHIKPSADNALPPDFDSEGYLRLNQDVAASGLSAIEHYTKYGFAEGRAYSVLQSDPQVVIPVDFDPEVYLKLNPDVALAGMDAETHFTLAGFREGRAYRENPSQRNEMADQSDSGGTETSSPRPDLLNKFLSKFSRACRPLIGRVAAYAAVRSIRTERQRFHLITGDLSTLQESGLLKPDHYLDEKRLNDLYVSNGHQLGSVPAHKAERYIERVAWALSKRISRKVERQSNLPAAMISQAWFFLILSEAFRIIPAKHLARILAREADGDLIVIPLKTKEIKIFSYWHESSVDLIYLAIFLKRYKANVCFSSKEVEFDGVNNEKNGTIDFVPHSAFISRPLVETVPESATPTSAVVPAGIRNWDISDPRHTHCLITQSAWVSVSFRPDFALGPDFWPPIPKMSLALTLLDLKSPSRQYAKCDPPQTSLFDILIKNCHDLTAHFLERAEHAVSTAKIETLHICDHSFLEAAVMAHAVRKAGGKVVSWPHSANAVHVHIRKEGDFSSIKCVTRSGMKEWKKRLPNTPCEIDSSIMLRQPNRSSVYFADRSLTIVVIGSYHAMGRLPILVYEHHIQAYKRMFSYFQNRGGFHLVYKPRDPWESAEWLQSVIGADIEVEVTRDHPTEISYPNMVYVCVSIASSALLEGLGRGIPCVIVRETDVSDYIDLSDAPVPIGSVEEIGALLCECKSAASYQDLLQKQVAWYHTETAFK